MNHQQETDFSARRFGSIHAIVPLPLLYLLAAAAFILIIMIDGRPLRTIESAFLDPQGSGLDYSKFIHSSQKHASLGCTSCHQRTSDNSVTPVFPGHKACTDCHLAQFVTPAMPMCMICHSEVGSRNPPLRAFPVNFKESFNVKFDHVQHMTGSAKPQKGCQGCHDRLLNRGVAISIPARLAAHSDCYVCHNPGSKSSAGREIASCGVCHEQKPFVRRTINTPAYRVGFSHAKHGARQRLDCADCHNLIAGAPLSRQVTSPGTAEHFFSGRGMSCMSCHNGKPVFGGDLAFGDCRRCHTGPTFRTPI